MLLFCRLDDGQPRLLVAGGKGVGKSTFLRFLVNRVLAEVGAPVLVVDLDPGQAEFTVPGWFLGRLSLLIEYVAPFWSRLYFTDILSRIA